jgi:tetratricopeptide (TPR) repeat protein
VLYAKRAGTEGARITAARILTSLGGHLLDASMTSSALSNFNQALLLDPRDTAALRSLGVLAEKVGRLEEAKAIFERLLGIVPGDPEAKLRLALIAGKLKDPQTALAGLREAVASPATPDWLAELAVQELAQALAHDGRLPQAAQVVHSGVERFPDSQRLLIQLSYLYERQGQRGMALETAEKAAALKVSAEGTPRWRYNRWPQEDLAVVRNNLQETVTPRLQLLAAALAASGTGSAAQASAAGGAN